MIHYHTWTYVQVTYSISGKGLCWLKYVVKNHVDGRDIARWPPWYCLFINRCPLIYNMHPLTNFSSTCTKMLWNVNMLKYQFDYMTTGLPPFVEFVSRLSSYSTFCRSSGRTTTYLCIGSVRDWPYRQHCRRLFATKTVAAGERCGLMNSKLSRKILFWNQRNDRFLVRLGMVCS